MRALIATPSMPGISVADVPLPGDGEVLLRTLEVGVCGTDREIAAGLYGSPPAGDDYLVIGHEVVAEVVAPQPGLPPGTLVTVTVRRGCDHCSACRSGLPDSCFEGTATEHGMLGLHGFAVDRFLARRSEIVPLAEVPRRQGVLLEPMSICERAWRHARHVMARGPHRLRHALVIGGGTLGALMATLIRALGLNVHVISRAAISSPSAAWFRRAGCTYATLGGPLGKHMHDQGHDIVVDTTGDAQVSVEAVAAVAPNGVLCLLGIDARVRQLRLDSLEFGSAIVEHNKAIIGSVNAAPSDWAAAAISLAAINRHHPGLLENLIGLRVPVHRHQEALDHRGSKAVISFEDVE